MDGVETALTIGDLMDVPVVYLTAYTDEQTVERVKLTQPYGYLVKPFSDRELQTAIELALHKYEMESHLKEREKWLSATLRSIGEGVIVTSPEGTVRFMNPAAPIQEGPVPFLSSLQTRDGRSLPVMDSASPIQGFRGETAGMVMVLRDLSRRMESELSARGMRETLQQDGSTLDAMVRMAGGVAHDFNNHLSVILGACELLAADLQGEPERLRMVEDILAASKRSAGLTKRLVAFAQCETFPLRRVDVNASVRRVEARTRESLELQMHLEVRLDPDAGKVLSDWTYLEHALDCLLQNGREAMPAGGNLLLATAKEELTREAADGLVLPLVPGRYVRVDVGDTGHGIPPHLLPRLFEPFFTTKGQATGAGLGLATVYGVILRSRGNLRVVSRPGVGTMVCLYLPEAL
jgi:two-component system cell cycle sensor histidine kinase/response regulator CckA